MQAELYISLYCLRASKTLLYPSDTVWGLGCDATDPKAVSKIFAIKKRDESKSFVVLVDSLAMLLKYVDQLPEVLKPYLANIKKPTTVIYNKPKGLAKNLLAPDNTIAIRIVEQGFCNQLIGLFQKPIVSTSANISGEVTPKSFKEINPSILEAVDYVVNLQQDQISTSTSTIIRLNRKGEVEVIRQ